MKMDKLLAYNFSGLFLLLLFCIACSTEVENNILGEWNLKHLESTCLEGNITQEIESFESNGFCCINIRTTEIKDTIELTNETNSCQLLIFKENDILDIITQTNLDRDTLSLSYELLDNNIEVCPTGNQCLNYTLINNEIELTIEVTTLSGLSCERKFIYRR